MYGQRRWTVTAPLSMKLVSTAYLKNSYGNVYSCITAIVRCPFPAAIASALHGEIHVTPVHTFSALCVSVSFCVTVHLKSVYKVAELFVTMYTSVYSIYEGHLQSHGN